MEHDFTAELRGGKKPTTTRNRPYTTHRFIQIRRRVTTLLLSPSVSPRLKTVSSNCLLTYRAKIRSRATKNTDEACILHSFETDVVVVGILL
mmetsp:Transcript_5689/g.8015  ORF Transcript_5689/g.8015 Transcript_5689/m.8015 type:complete len:92 (-) Transcript_5689:118-393(-)